MNAVVMRLRTSTWLLLLSLDVAFGEQKQSGIEWQPWSDSAFAQAQKEGRFVLLNLGAVWCHWCHVMDDITYQDRKVIELIRSHYVAVWVDEDSLPDLANRYEDYGWPATIVFGADKGEIVKRRGYIPPRPMASRYRRSSMTRLRVRRSFPRWN